MKKNTASTPKFITLAKISYRIFELTDEGHFREPKKDYDDYIFSHYSGYGTIEEAKQAIEDHDKKYAYGYGKEYIVLPIVKTSRIKKE